ncbi:hypothetical protein BCEN4_140094 [Burkholderia cenocepacia]|nr:hypothetical protein BCEN4_140094 [Burkholderia cenocepacia]
MRGPTGAALSDSALALLRVPRRAVIAAMTVMTLAIFPLAAFPVAAAVPVAVAMPADDHRRRCDHDGGGGDDHRRGRADVDVDVDGVSEAGQRKAEAGESEGDQRALHVLFRGVVMNGPTRRDGSEGDRSTGGTPRRHNAVCCGTTEKASRDYYGGLAARRHAMGHPFDIGGPLVRLIPPHRAVPAEGI